MKPARARLSKNLIPIDVARLQLRDRGVPTIVTSQRCTHAEAALRKIEAVARGAAHAIVLHPAHQRLVHAALVNEILKEPPDRIIGERRDDRGVQAETTLQPACNVVFPSALAHFKGSRRGNAPVARVEPHHNLAQTNEVPVAFFLRFDGQPHALTSTTYSIGNRLTTHCHDLRGKFPDSRLGFSIDPGWLQPGSQNMDYGECHQIGRASNKEWNLVAPSPLKHVAHDGGDEQTPDGTRHASDSHNRADGPSRKHV